MIQMLPNDVGRANIKVINSSKICFVFLFYSVAIHILVNSLSALIHRFAKTIHNLKKFFALRRRKYTLIVNKDLSSNILLSKKENINRWQKKFLRLHRRN